MKIIKSFLPVAICLCSTMALHAQEIQTGKAKPVETKMPPAANINTPSPQPELKPQPQTEAITAAAPATAAKGKSESADLKPADKNKPVMKVVDPVAAVPTPNTIDKDPKVLPAAKSTASKQQQNQ